MRKLQLSRQGRHWLVHQQGALQTEGTHFSPVSCLSLYLGGDLD